MDQCLNIINALKNSTRLKHWDKPPRDYGPNNPEDSDYNRNGLKDVGDLSKVDFSRQFSFTSEPESNDHEETQEESKDEEQRDLQPSFYSTAEEAEEFDHHCHHHHHPQHITPPSSSSSSSLDIAKKAYEQYRLNIMLENLSLDKKYKEAIQRKTQQKQESYLQSLREIHSQHEEEMKRQHVMQKEKLKHEELLLRKREEQAQIEVENCRKEYTSQVSQYSTQLLEAVESARRQELEHANIVHSLLTQLQTAYGDYVIKLDSMYNLIKDLEGSEVVNRTTESHLIHTRSLVEGILNAHHHRPTTKGQIEETYNTLQQSLTLVDSIVQKLETRKVEKSNLEEAERIQQENERAKAEALELERQKRQQEQEEEEARRKQERIDNERKNEPPSVKHEEKLLELKQRVTKYLDASEQLSKDQQWEVRRKATMANQLNKDNHSINKEKLHKLLAEMREGKTEATVQASFKNSVVSNIVKQVAIQDTLGGSAYSWLLVELVTFHPDLWDLFLFYLYKACPALIPGSAISDESANVKTDIYYSQIGKYCSMYGFVLSRLNKKQGNTINPVAIGWELVAKVLSQPPLSGVTGELLLRFMQSFGFTLQETYRRQFVKVMEFVVKTYLPKIREATEEGGQNCLTLLENYIAEYRPGKLAMNPMIVKYM